jgi:hypothetical protein
MHTIFRFQGAVIIKSFSHREKKQIKVFHRKQHEAKKLIEMKKIDAEKLKFLVENFTFYQKLLKLKYVKSHLNAYLMLFF